MKLSEKSLEWELKTQMKPCNHWTKVRGQNIYLMIIKISFKENFLVICCEKYNYPFLKYTQVIVRFVDNQYRKYSKATCELEDSLFATLLLRYCFLQKRRLVMSGSSLQQQSKIFSSWSPELDGCARVISIQGSFTSL